ncbi:uncharacterized protein METZ01_LOCUS155364, partial [marine metagenome]
VIRVALDEPPLLLAAARSAAEEGMGTTRRNTWLVYSSSRFVADIGSMPRLTSTPSGNCGPGQ